MAAERERIAGYHDRLGRIGRRIELAGESLMFSGDPGYYLHRLERQQNTRPDEVTRVPRRCLGAPAFVLRVEGTGSK